MFGTLVGMSVFSVSWAELLMTSDISCPLWSSVYECQRVECAFTSSVMTECGMFDVLYVVLYVRVRCFVVFGYAVLRRYINVCNCDMFNVVIVHLVHFKFCVVCINSRRYVCYRGDLGFLNYDDIFMCIVNEQFELLEFVFDSVYDDQFHSNLGHQ